MKLKAYKTTNTRRALRVTLISDYLDADVLEEYRIALDCVSISPEMYISIFRASNHPTINIDEYFMYMDLIDMDFTRESEERHKTFPILLEILETKYGIEYADPEY